MEASSAGGFPLADTFYLVGFMGEGHAPGAALKAATFCGHESQVSVRLERFGDDDGTISFRHAYTQ